MMKVIATALAAMGALAACKTTSAEAEQQAMRHERIVIKKIEGDAKSHIKIVLPREGQETIVIEGDPSDPEIGSQLKELEEEGLLTLSKIQGDGQLEVLDDEELDLHLEILSEVAHDLAEQHGDENNHKVIIRRIKAAEGKDGDADKSDADVAHAKIKKRIVILGDEVDDETLELLRSKGIEIEIETEGSVSD